MFSELLSDVLYSLFSVQPPSIGQKSHVRFLFDEIPSHRVGHAYLLSPLFLFGCSGLHVCGQVRSGPVSIWPG